MLGYCFYVISIGLLSCCQKATSSPQNWLLTDDLNSKGAKDMDSGTDTIFLGLDNSGNIVMYTAGIEHRNLRRIYFISETCLNSYP